MDKSIPLLKREHSESLLDCKGIKLVSPKGNHPWIFTGRTDTEAEAPILCPPDVKSQLFGKDHDFGKDWRWEENGSRGWDGLMASHREPWAVSTDPDVQTGSRNGTGTRDQIANIHWIIKKARKFQKNIYFCFIDYAKALIVWITTNWKTLQEMGIPDHLTCLLWNLYAGQEAKVRTGHGNRLGPNWERSTSRLYIVTLLT